MEISLEFPYSKSFSKSTHEHYERDDSQRGLGNFSKMACWQRTCQQNLFHIEVFYLSNGVAWYIGISLEQAWSNGWWWIGCNWNICFQINQSDGVNDEFTR